MRNRDRICIEINLRTKQPRHSSSSSATAAAVDKTASLPDHATTITITIAIVEAAGLCDANGGWVGAEQGNHSDGV